MLDGFSDFDAFRHMQQYEPNLQGSDDDVWHRTHKLFWFVHGGNWNLIHEVSGTGLVPVFRLLFFYHGATALVVQGLLIVEDTWSRSDTPHSVGLLWTSDKPEAETFNWQHNRRTSTPPAGFKPTSPASQQPQTHALDRAATGIGRLQACFFPSHRHYRMIIYTLIKTG